MKTFSYSLDHAGNRWMGSYASGYGAVNMNDSSQFNLSSSLFIIDPNLGSDYNPAIPTDTLDPPFFVNDQGWIEFFSPGNTFSCSGQYSCNAWLTGGDDGSMNLKLRIARDSTLTSEYIPESKTVAKQYLYDKLSADSILTGSNIEFENFIATHELDNIGYLHVVKEALEKFTVPHADVANNLQTIDSLMALYTDSLFAAGENERPGLIAELNSLNAQRNFITEQWKSSVAGELITASDKNSLVTTDDDPVMNEKFINEVTIQYLQGGKESIAAYYNELYSVANQCPYKGGLAVYRARTLVSLFNDSIEYEDDNVCMQEGIFRTMNQNQWNESNEQISIKPNPANDKAIISLSGYEEGICIIKVYNSTGVEILNNSFACNEKKYQLDLSVLPAGMYSITVNANGKIATKRIVKISGFPLLLIILLFAPLTLFAQGFNKTWLLGNSGFTVPKGRMLFDLNSYQYNQEYRKMSFRGTQATICDANGNFLMSSNGVWIANALNDTMQNGAGLNPGPYVNANPNGLLIPHGNLFLPYPGDSSKYLLIHQTGTQNSAYPSFELYYSVVDIYLDGGLGGVIEKNQQILQDTISWGVSACKHANGRDWWVIAQKDSSDLIYTILFTPNGVESITAQHLGYSPLPWGNVDQPVFSHNGEKFMTTTYNPVPGSLASYLVISDFNRCTGMFSNTQTIQITTNSYLWGNAFSPSGKYAYTCTTNSIYQIDTDNLSVQVVANYDGFISGLPPTCCPTSFLHLYLAANGKIYITSGSSVQHIHEMNYPDSAGTACDVQQHNIFLGIWNFRSVPNHPNYYLGPVTGSVCDSLNLSVSESKPHDFRFSLSPNPNNGNFQIMYLLPQNKAGMFEVYDIHGRKVYEQRLPPWSTMQQITLPSRTRSPEGRYAPVSSGIYSCVITSGSERAVKKVVVVKE